MLALILALSVGARPAELVKPGEEAAYAAWLEERVRATISASAGRDCSQATLKEAAGQPASPADPVRKALPKAYFYYEKFSVAGCGAADTQQLLVRRDGDQWRSVGLAPGRTVATLVLQRDLLQGVAQAMVAQMAKKGVDCKGDALAKSFRISDTRLMTPFVPGQPWTERWVVAACDADYPVDVSLRPTADGGTDYSAHIPNP